MFDQFLPSVSVISYITVLRSRMFKWLSLEISCNLQEARHICDRHTERKRTVRFCWMSKQENSRPWDLRSDERLTLETSVIEMEVNSYYQLIKPTVKNIWKSYIWTADKEVSESDPRSNVHYLGSRENKACKKFRPVRDLNPWLLRYRCSVHKTK